MRRVASRTNLWKAEKTAYHNNKDITKAFGNGSRMPFLFVKFLV